MSKWERPRPTGQSARAFFVDAFARVVGTVVTLTTLAVLWNRHATFPVLVYVCEEFGSCGYEIRRVPVADYGAGLSQFGPQLPFYEHLGRLLYAVVTFAPVTASLGAVALVTVVLYARPELNRLPLRGAA